MLNEEEHSFSVKDNVLAKRMIIFFSRGDPTFKNYIIYKDGKNITNCEIHKINNTIEILNKGIVRATCEVNFNTYNAGSIDFICTKMSVIDEMKKVGFL